MLAVLCTSNNSEMMCYTNHYINTYLWNFRLQAKACSFFSNVTKALCFVVDIFNCCGKEKKKIYHEDQVKTTHHYYTSIAYAVMNSMENLVKTEKYGELKKVISTFYFSTRHFIKEIENIFSRVPIRYRNTRGSLGKLQIARKRSPYGLLSHFYFSFS